MFVVMSMVGVVGGCGCGYVGPGGVVCLVGFVYLVVLDLSSLFLLYTCTLLQKPDESRTDNWI